MVHGTRHVISSKLNAGTPITHVAEMAGNSARTIEKHYYKNTKQEELRQRMNARYGSGVYDRQPNNAVRAIASSGIA